MIFFTVGTHSDGFDRLVTAADEFAAISTERVVVQYGCSQVRPANAEGFDFAGIKRIEALSKEARVIVTHAGAGSILTSLQAGAHVIVVPRLKQHGEHMDDHQTELADALNATGQVRAVRDLAELPGTLTSLSGPRGESTLAEAPLASYLRRRLRKLSEDSSRPR